MAFVRQRKTRADYPSGVRLPCRIRSLVQPPEGGTIKLNVQFCSDSDQSVRYHRFQPQEKSNETRHHLSENRPGAGGNIATDAVVRAPPDGYTLLMFGINSAINASSYDNLNFNFIRDITAVATIGGVPSIIAVHPSFPAKTIPEFIAYARTNPGKANMASEGIGGFGVPYRGAAPALTDLMGAQVQVMFVTVPSSIQYVRAGKLRALAVTSATRAEALPDIPTVGEFLPGYFADSFRGDQSQGLVAGSRWPFGRRHASTSGHVCGDRGSSAASFAAMVALTTGSSAGLLWSAHRCA
jgi:hypothetical protein